MSKQFSAKQLAAQQRFKQAIAAAKAGGATTRAQYAAAVQQQLGVSLKAGQRQAAKARLKSALGDQYGVLIAAKRLISKAKVQAGLKKAPKQRVKPIKLVIG